MMRARILIGEIAPGTPVRQDAIALQMGVSKIPLREALTRLEQDGLLSSHPNRGFVVSPLSADEAEEIFALRFKLEPEAVAQACLVATPEDRARVLLALTSLEEKQDSDSKMVHVALNRSFHMSLVRPGAGRVTYQLLERLHVLAERYVHVHLEPASRNSRAKDEHRQLLGLWFDGKAEEVQSMTAAHIHATLNDLRRQLKI